MVVVLNIACCSKLYSYVLLGVNLPVNSPCSAAFGKHRSATENGGNPIKQQGTHSKLVGFRPKEHALYKGTKKNKNFKGTRPWTMTNTKLQYWEGLLTPMILKEILKLK